MLSVTSRPAPGATAARAVLRRRSGCGEPEAVSDSGGKHLSRTPRRASDLHMAVGVEY